ncbi:MAG TPA: DMT family transporter [Terriglobales bacterium]|nr:DMT family transporter [Terriglobales bacterium]
MPTSLTATESRSDRRVQSWLATGALALSGVFWGTGFYFGKVAFAEMSVTQDVAWRFIFGSALLIPILVRSRMRYSRSDLGLIVLASAIGVPLQFLVQFKGLQLTTVSHASLMVGTLPMLLAFSSVLVLHEHLSGVEWLVLLASALGAMLIAISSSASNGPRASLRGDLLVLVSMLAAVVMILISKRLMERHPPLEVTAVIIILGTVFLLIWTLGTQGLQFHFSRTVWIAAVAQGALATAFAYLFWNWGLARVPASRAGVFLNLEPVVGTAMGIALLGERLGVAAIFGGAMILASAVYFSRRNG